MTGVQTCALPICILLNCPFYRLIRDNNTNEITYDNNKHKISTETCEDCISRNTCSNLLIFLQLTCLDPLQGLKLYFHVIFLHLLLSQIQPQNPFLIHCAANYSRPSVLIDSNLSHFIFSDIYTGHSWYFLSCTFICLSHTLDMIEISPLKLVQVVSYK